MTPNGNGFEWQDRAACRNFPDLVLFYNMSAYRDPAGAMERLRSLCSDCPVRRPCRQLVDRLESGTPQSHWAGFWAGETVKDRIARRTRPGKPKKSQ